MVGFCYGGGVANMLATRVPDLAAAVPFYGSQAKTEDVPKIKATLLIHYAEKDDRINAGWPAYEAALKAHNVKYTTHTYPGTQHGFNNNTTPRYDEPRPSWPGSARSTSSTSICADSRATEAQRRRDAETITFRSLCLGASVIVSARV